MNVEHAAIHVQEGINQLSKARVYQVLLIKCFITVYALIVDIFHF